MSDKSSKTRPSAPSKGDKKTVPLKPVVSTSLSDGPEESQVPEPPPGGGQQPGDRIDRAPPRSNF